LDTCLINKGISSSDLLGFSEFFQDISLNEIDFSRIHKHSYNAGEEILRYHDHSNSVFFVLSGEVRVHYYALSGDEVILCDLPAGEMFGELTAIDGKKRSATVVAKTDALLASISDKAFVQLIHDNPAFCMAILKRLTDQVRRLTERVFDFSTLAVRNRIHTELLRLARQNMVSPNSAEISPVPTHAELACFVSTHREAITRELSELTKHRIIQRTGHVLRIPDVEKLERMVNDVRGVTDSL
jgi:CRP/FNR family transcriptional regulator, cyclic AMP receptor protein